MPERLNESPRNRRRFGHGIAHHLSPTSILSRNTFTFIPNSESNTLSRELRDRKALYLDSTHSTGREEIMSGLEVLERKSNSGEAGAAVEVVLKHSGVENRIIGSPETVLRELLSYFSKIYPSIELVSKLVLSVDSLEFLQSCTGVLAVSSEGLVVLKDLRELKDKELLMIHLAGSRLLHQMGKKESDTLSLDEITKTTGRSTGTVAGRLSELCNEQLVERVGKGSYRLTTMGTRVVIKNLMPRVAQLPER